MFNFIPTFMRSPTYAVMGMGMIGVGGWNYYRQYIDKQLKHPLVRESIFLLQNNDDVVQLIGVPISLSSSNSGATIKVSEDVANFSFYVNGPRGKLRIEMAGISNNLSQLKSTGPSQTKKEILELGKLNETMTYSEYYVPDPKLAEEYLDLSKPPTPEEEALKLSPENRFWKFEYLYAEVDKDVRILIAPDEQLKESQPNVAKRETFADLKKEYNERLSRYRILMGSKMTKEELSEMSKLKYDEFYRTTGYARIYMFVGTMFFLMNAYILFLKNKRKPLVGGSLVRNLQSFALRNPDFRAKVGDSNNVHFLDMTVGSQIDKMAEFGVPFSSPSKAGVLYFYGKHNKATGLWMISKIDVEFKDSTGFPEREKMVLATSGEL
jgi:hypothetical protein